MSVASELIGFAVQESKAAIFLYFEPLRKLRGLVSGYNSIEEELSDPMLESLAGGYTSEAFLAKSITTRVGDVVVMRLPARMSISQGYVLRNLLAAQLTEGYRKVVLDLSNVEVIDSSGVGELVGLYTAASNQGASLKLVGLPPRIADILTTGQMISYRTSEEAIESF